MQDDGLHVGAGLGLRYMLEPFFGLSFDLTGSYNHYPFSGSQTIVFRLELAAGIVFKL